MFPEKLIFSKNKCRTPKLSESASLVLSIGGALEKDTKKSTPKLACFPREWSQWESNPRPLSRIDFGTCKRSSQLNLQLKYFKEQSTIKKAPTWSFFLLWSQWESNPRPLSRIDFGTCKRSSQQSC